MDVACLYHEGAPLNFNDIQFTLPPGYDYDLCTAEIIQRMTVEKGFIHLPSGVSYRYLVLPASGRLTLPVARKVAELKRAGACVYLQKPITGTPGLEGYPETDQEVKALAKEWPLLPKAGWGEVFAADRLVPDFQGDGLKWIHRKSEGTDIYFIANTNPESTILPCSFRCTGKIIELWNPETGDIYALPTAPFPDGSTGATLRFEPAQSWFVIFRDQAPGFRVQEKGVNFSELKPVMELSGAWQLTFDPKWGGPDQPVTFDKLTDWTDQSDSGIKYYSGTATYRKTFDLPQVSSFKLPVSKRYLDLGKVEVMARVKVNNKDCGIVWKPPYRVEISNAVRNGQNELEIEVVNTWVNRMIGDEQLPLDSQWKDWETLLAWPEWFKQGGRSSAGRYTFTTARHYKKDSPLQPSGLLGPVKLMEVNPHQP